jgi:plasmid stabilization system protein ParE
MKKELFKVELSDEAEIDFDKSYEYYSTISLKVADNFYKQINSSFLKIAGSPFSCQQVYLEIRQFVLKVPIHYLFQDSGNCYTDYCNFSYKQKSLYLAKKG